MADIPIIFSAPMIRALLDGRKTMTRRMLYSLRKAQNGIIPASATVHRDHPPPRGMLPLGQYWTLSGWQKVKPGDRLWCRERFGSCEVEGQGIGNYFIIYDEEWSRRFEDRGAGEPRPKVLRPSGMKPGLHPSIHMPRWASRLSLVVTATKIERLNDITCADAIAEGIAPAANSQTIDSDTPDPRDAFRDLWNSLHGADAWAANPEVVALSFIVHKANIDRLGKEAA